VNPGVARLAIVVALVVGGIAVLANGFSGAETPTPRTDETTPPPTTESPTPTKTPGNDELVPQPKGEVLVQVLNGTNTAGFAGDFQLLLEDEGYLRAGEPADAPEKPILDTVVFFRRDDSQAQHRVDARALSDEYLGGSAVEPMPPEIEDVVNPAADVVVLLGEDRVGSP
jgi:hypothetical protein